MTITFWKNNQISGEHQKHVAEIAADFLNSKGVAKQNFDAGWPFERAILLFMADEYGAFDRLTDAQFKGIWDNYKMIEPVVQLLNRF